MPLPPGISPIVRVFSFRNYAFYMGGMTPTLVTLWMQRLGVGWLAWELTHSPTWLGAISAAVLAPMLVLGPVAGAVVDRRVPLTLQKIAQALAVLHALALAVLTFAGLMNIWLLFGLALFLGITQTFASTARHAIVPSTVPREFFATAVALDSALFNAASPARPARWRSSRCSVSAAPSPPIVSAASPSLRPCSPWTCRRPTAPAAGGATCSAT